MVDVEKPERQQFALNDHELHELAKQALIIEQHYGSPMDIEWAKDGDDELKSTSFKHVLKLLKAVKMSAQWNVTY